MPREKSSEELSENVTEILETLKLIVARLDNLGNTFLPREVYEERQKVLQSQISSSVLLSRIGIAMIGGIVISALVAWLIT